MFEFRPVEGRIVFLDTEFTSLDKLRREVWEIGVIVRDPGQPDVEVEWQIRPDLTDASPDSLRIGRYYERNRIQERPVGTALMTVAPTDPAGGPSDEELESSWRFFTTASVAAILARMLSGAYLVGAVVSADETALDPFMRRNGQSLAHHYRLRCVETLALGYVHGLRAERATVPGTEASLRVLNEQIPAPPWSTDTLSKLCGVPPRSEEDAHRALVDARWARDMWDAVHGNDRR